VTRTHRLLLLAWSLLLLGLAGGVTWTLARAQRENVVASRAKHAQRTQTTGSASGTEAERTPPPGHEHDVPRSVRVGVYLDRVYEFSVVNSSWKADVYVWFNWDGDGLDPGATFHVVGGEVLSRTIAERRDDGAHHYQLMRASIQMTKVFDVMRFPRDEHQLLITIEDAARQSYEQIYVPDTSSSFSSRVTIPGYATRAAALVVKPHAYKTARGDPDLPTDYHATYSQAAFVLDIGRPDWGFFLKQFIGLYAVVFIGMLAIFVADPAARLGLVSAALFGAVANGYVIASRIPDTGATTLADQLNGIGLATVGICILQAVIHQGKLAGRPELVALNRAFDRVSFVLILVVYAAMNVILPLAATG
jgi:hypothetical protein